MLPVYKRQEGYDYTGGTTHVVTGPISISSQPL